MHFFRESVKMAHQLVLVSCYSSELCLRKDESPIFLLLDILHGPSLPLPSLHQVDAGLELVHRVQDQLKDKHIDK